MVNGSMWFPKRANRTLSKHRRAYGGESMNQLETFMQTFVSRRDDFALQRTDGGYVRVGRSLTTQEVHSHLAGKQTIGSHVIDEHGQCAYAVFDAASHNGLPILRGVQCRLARE